MASTMDVEGNQVDSDTMDVRGMAIRRAKEAAAAAYAEMKEKEAEGLEVRKVRVGVVARTDLGAYKDAKEVLKLTKEAVAKAAELTGAFDKEVAAVPGGRDTRLAMCKVNAKMMEEAIERSGDLELYEPLMTYDVSCRGIYKLGVVFEMDNDLAEAVNEMAAALCWIEKNGGGMLRFHAEDLHADGEEDHLSATGG
jgi:hypothetical protein